MRDSSELDYHVEYVLYNGKNDHCQGNEKVGILPNVRVLNHRDLA